MELNRFGMKSSEQWAVTTVQRRKKKSALKICRQLHNDLFTFSLESLLINKRKKPHSNPLNDMSSSTLPVLPRALSDPRKGVQSSKGTSYTLLFGVDCTFDATKNLGTDHHDCRARNGSEKRPRNKIVVGRINCH